MGRPTKPKSKGIALPEGSSARDYWKKVRAAISKATKEDLQVPSITNRLRTGLTFLDKPTGGGLPGGRACLIHGGEGALKSSFLYHLGAQAQEQGGFFWLANPEDSWNEPVARMLKVDLDETRFMYTRPLNIEEWLLSLDKFLDSGITDVDVPIVIGLDTLAMLAPKKESENDIRHSGLPMGTPGKLAQYFRSTDALKRLTNSNVYLVFLQQHRDQTGGSSYGPPTDKVPGGRALRHYISTRIEMSIVSATAAKENGVYLVAEETKGRRWIDCSKFSLEKLRDEVGGRSFYVPYHYRSGWLNEIACFDFMAHHGYMETRGNYLVWNGESRYRMDWYKEIVKPENTAVHELLREQGGQCFYQELFDESCQEDRWNQK